MYQRKLDPIPLTQKGYQQALAELQKLELYREEVLVRLQKAREMGDLSENGAYKAARFELSDTDRKLRRLKLLQLYGQVTSAPTNGEIGFNSKVTVLQQDREITYHLVSEYEADPAQHKISLKSPIGQALLKKKMGDVIQVHAPAGLQQLTIMRVH